MDIVINHLNFISRHHDKCKVALTFSPLVTTSNIFSLEIEQKRQVCQLCVSRKTGMATSQNRHGDPSGLPDLPDLYP